MGTRADERCAEAVPCEHYYASHNQSPGHLVPWVRQCMLCHTVDADDLDSEVGKLLANMRQESLLSLAAELDERATRSLDSHMVKDAFRFAAELARSRASVSHAATAEPGSGQAEDRQPGERSVDFSATEGTP